MSTCEDTRPHLSEFVDGTLVGDAATRTAAHVESCPNCGGLVDDLTRLRAAAATLGPIQPPDHVWLEVAGQIRLDDHPRQVSQPATAPSRRPRVVNQWLGLAAALVIATLGVVLVQRASGPDGTTGNPSVPGSVEVVAEELRAAMLHYENAIAELERMAASGDRPLDPAVAATLDESLGVVDQAIADSRQALATEPGNEPARESLFQALRQKVGLLQTTVSLVNEMRKNDADGGARGAAGRSSL
jgi:hypothetical protein